MWCSGLAAGAPAIRAGDAEAAATAARGLLAKAAQDAERLLGSPSM
ncbi:hypothetical protein AB0392_07610 [Nonomuraea angiospora]